ncbi:MAG: hypothetical protein EA413_14365 [Cyanobium sp. PLM2.Bin73]|nr:MAG: hypothetical protein EA413_14365 [Cyanobium sp. PLM2.Bin73]
MAVLKGEKEVQKHGGSPVVPLLAPELDDLLAAEIAPPLAQGNRCTLQQLAAGHLRHLVVAAPADGAGVVTQDHRVR